MEVGLPVAPEGLECVTPKKETTVLRELECVPLKKEPREHQEHVGESVASQGFEFIGVKLEPLEDPEAEAFVPQEPECILVQKDEVHDSDVPTEEPRPTQEPECIIVQKVDDEPAAELQPTQVGGTAHSQVHENGVQQRPSYIPGEGEGEGEGGGGGGGGEGGGRGGEEGVAAKDEEVILGLVPEVEWVPPCLPPSDETLRDPLASEGEVITDSVNEDSYATGWSQTSGENQYFPSGDVDYRQLALVTVNSGGPAYNTSVARGYKSDGTETVQQAFRCDSCSAIFSTKYHLVNHVFTHITEVPPPSHVCRRCGDVFGDTASLIGHSKGHESNPEEPAASSKWSEGPAGSGRPGKKQKKRRIRKRPETKPHICDLCGKAFPLLGNLNSHKRTHSGERPYKCDVCGKAFIQSIHLKNHRVTHTAEKRHYCEFCGRPFSLVHTLKVHMRMHTGENPYRCEVCGAAFNLLGKLKTHQQVHTGRKPYRCDECGNSFAAPNSLRRHKRMHSGEKPFSCSVCGEFFMWSASLKRHMQVHTGEKPFKCDLCSSSFAEMGGLNRHMRIHTGERPFVCDLCGASFTVSNHLKRHLRRQHVENSSCTATLEIQRRRTAAADVTVENPTTICNELF